MAGQLAGVVERLGGYDRARAANGGRPPLLVLVLVGGAAAGVGRFAAAVVGQGGYGGGVLAVPCWGWGSRAAAGVWRGCWEAAGRCTWPWAAGWGSWVLAWAVRWGGWRGLRCWWVLVAGPGIRRSWGWLAWPRGWESRRVVRSGG